MKPGGKVVISVPNKLNLIKVLKYKGKLFTGAELSTIFKDAGFKNVKTKSLCFVPGAFTWDSKLKVLENVDKVPLIGEMGGNVMAVGEK